MPDSKYLQLSINNQSVDLGDIANVGVKINYTLETPEEWESKQSSDVQSVTVPATRNNDTCFNSFHDISVEDLTPGQIYRNLMPFVLSVNGTVPVLKGMARLNSATFTDKPEAYNIGLEGGNGDWLLNGQNLTLWDCVNPNPHTFNVATVQDSWQDFDSDEDHDYVYAPVRYRQPFDGTQQGHGPDDTVNIYMLRPSLSIYWMVIRGFRQLGYTIKSDFMASQYFRNLVMPWTWGDFFDINNKVTEALSFKAAGPQALSVPGTWIEWATGFPIYFGGTLGTEPSRDINNTGWKPWGPTAFGAPTDAPSTPTGYIQTLIEHTAGGDLLYQNFRINNTVPPAGLDNFGLYSFDDATGTMQYTITVPPSLVSLVGSNITMDFELDLICQTHCSSGGNHVYINIEVSKNGTFLFDEFFDELGATAGVTAGSLLFPTAHKFSVSGINNGDVLTFRLKWDIDSDIGTPPIIIMSSERVNVAPSVTGASDWQKDFGTGDWEHIAPGAIWQPTYSTFSMTGFQIELGGDVHFQWYDAFRNYKFFDMLGGLVDTFDLEIQTNPIDKSVTIEPFSGATLSDGSEIKSYFDIRKLVDWTSKQDLNTVNEVQLFANSERQIDFNFKQDGSDGGQNIYSARYKGIYLNNVKKNTVINGDINNGIVAGVPGASRYMLPNRFTIGNKQRSNRFFSSVIHYKHAPWAALPMPDSPATQLIAIIPENINDSSASAVTQTFEPKMAYYAGKQSILGVGGWRWIGDPASPYTDDGTPSAIGFQMPYMFAVDYTGHVATVPGQIAPVLSYCDQNINGTVTPGLMRTWFLKRMAIMRNGQLLNGAFRLDLDDVCRFEHREVVSIAGNRFALIGIEGYNPLSDAVCKCTMWKIVNAEQTDADNSYPSNASVASSPASLSQYDLRYAKLLIYYSDLPQV